MIKQRMSPIQLLDSSKIRETMMLRIAGDLVKIHQQFLAKVSELDEIIKKKIGPKGLPGKDAQPPSNERLLSLIKPLIPQVKDGYTPTKDELLMMIKPLVAGLENNLFTKVKTLKPIKGKDYLTEKDVNDLIDTISNSLPKSEVDPEEILKIFTQKGKKLKTDFIDGFEQTIASRFHQLARGYLHGGGDTIAAGSNITLTRNANGTVTISSSGGSGTWFQDELLAYSDGTNYALAHAPVTVVFIFVNGQLLRSGGVDYTRTGTAIVMISQLSKSDIVTATYS